MIRQTTLGAYRAIFITVGATALMAFGVMVMNSVVQRTSLSENDSLPNGQWQTYVPPKSPAEQHIALQTHTAPRDPDEPVTRADADSVPLTGLTPLAPAPANAPAPQPARTVATAVEVPPAPVAAPQNKPLHHPDTADIPACVATLRSLAQRTIIYFDHGSAVVDPRGREAIYLLAAKLQSCPEATVRVIGHSDPKGELSANLTLSWRRANAVLSVATQGGFDTSRFSTWSELQDTIRTKASHFEVVDRRVSFDVTSVENTRAALGSQ